MGRYLYQVAQQARSEKWPKDFRSILARRRRRGLCCQLGQMGCAVGRLCRVGEKMSDISRGIQMLNKRQQHTKCLLNPCNVVAQQVTSQPDTVDTTMTFIWLKTSWAQVGSRENNTYDPQCTAHLHPFCVVSHSCMVAEPVFLELWH